MNATDYLYLMRTRGWVLFPNVIDSELLDRLGPDLDRAIDRSRRCKRATACRLTPAVLPTMCWARAIVSTSYWRVVT